MLKADDAASDSDPKGDCRLCACAAAGDVCPNENATRELLPVLSLGILPVPVVVEVYRESLISKDYNFGRFTGTGKAASSQARLNTG